MAKNAEKKKLKQARKAEKHALKSERRKQRRKAKAVLSRQEMAEQLRSLAAQVEAGSFTLADIERRLPDRAGFAIGYRLKPKGDHRIEVRIGWGSDKAAGLPIPG